MTTPVFFVSSGRSGTASMTKLLNSFEDVEVHHEYMIYHIQPIAFKYYHGLISIREVVDKLWQTHGAAYYYTDAAIWGDSSNKLSWIIPALSWMFPEAKFIQLVRDGRKVVSSFYHKLAHECYADEEYEIMKSWIEFPRTLEPPPEKGYWWNITPEGYDRFKRLCWHWENIHEVIQRDLQDVKYHMTVKLEDLVADSYVVANMLNFLGLKYTPDKWKIMQTPHNVHHPRDYPLTEDEKEIFWDICGDMMDYFGYSGDEYRVEY